MANYKPTTATGWVNGGNIYDGVGTPGTTTTYGSLTRSTAGSSTATIGGFSSLTGMTGLTATFNRYTSNTVNGDLVTAPTVQLQYSWDGATWYTLETKTASTAQSDVTFTIGNFTSTTNLNTLQFRGRCTAGSWDDGTQSGVLNATLRVYDLYVTATTGYSPNLTQTAPGTGAGKSIYASNLYDAPTGVLGAPNTTTAAVYTTNVSNDGFYFYEGNL